jgi:hypothetical protein
MKTIFRKTQFRHWTTAVVLSFCASMTDGSHAAWAGELEFSVGGAYNRSNYDTTGDNYSWNRRWGASVSYEFFARSEIEFSFQDVQDRTMIVDYEDTIFHDRIYSLSWIQSLLPRSVPVQPYLKFGVAQLNRDASGTYAGGGSPNPQVDAVTGVLGGGLRIYLTRSFAIRSELVSYLTGGDLQTWQDNLAASVGISYSL